MRSPLYEQALKREGFREEDGSLTYLPCLELSDINVQAGIRNQARLLEPLDEELIDNYTIMNNAGSEAPAIVVHKKRNRPIWSPIDGNQRIAAAKKCGFKTIDAYQVNTEVQEVIDRLTWFFNNIVNGKRLTKEENIEHAVSAVQKYGWDVKVAAQQAGVSPRAITKRITTGKLRDILRGGGEASVAQLTDDKLEELYPLVKLGEEVFTEAAKIAYSCGLGLKDIVEMKKNVDRAKTNEGKIKAVVDFRNSPTAMQRRAETKGGKLKPRRFGKQPCEEIHFLLKRIDDLLNEFEKPALRRKGVGFKDTLRLARSVTDGLILTFGLGARFNSSHEKAGV